MSHPFRASTDGKPTSGGRLRGSTAIEFVSEVLPVSRDGADDVREGVQIAQVDHFTG